LGEAFEVGKLVVEALVLSRNAKVEGGVHMVGTWVDRRESRAARVLEGRLRVRER
jgi:hypothetical protein